jgi:hypothetical protein
MHVVLVLACITVAACAELTQVSLRCLPSTSFEDLHVSHGVTVRMQTAQDTYDVSMPKDSLDKMALTSCRVVSQNIQQNEFLSVIDFNSYANLTQIELYIQQLTQLYPQNANYIEYGSSFEGNTLFSLLISTNVTNITDTHENETNTTRPMVLITSLSHAREWISGMASCYIANKILSSLPNNDLSQMDFLIVPVLNPDGFNYSLTKDRLWRNSRSIIPNVLGKGVDLDRNFPSGWGMGSLDVKLPGQPTYIGPFALSEPETEAFVKNLTDSYRGRIKAVLDFQSYGQIVFSPLMYQKTLDENANILQTLANNISQSMTNVYGNSFTHRSAPDLGFSMGGTLIDYMYEHHGAVSFTVSLRDKGKFKWHLPVDQILPASEEAFAAVMQIVSWVSTNNDTLLNVPRAFSSSLQVTLSTAVTLVAVLLLLLLT